MTMPVASNDPYDIFAPRSRSDPELLARLRRDDPVYCTTVPGWGTRHWFLSRYEDCNNFLRDSRFGRDLHNKLPEEILRHWPKPPLAEQMFERHLLGVDPPDHTRMRGLVHKAFTPRVIRRLQDRVQEIADQLIDAMQDAGRADLVEQYAFPIPITMITEMLGVPVADHNRFRGWIRRLFFEAADDDARMLAGMEFVHYMHARIDERRAEPQEDILSGMVHASEEGDMLNQQELMSMIFLLLTAGYETTVHLIGSGVFTLLCHPDQLALFRSEMDSNDALVQSAVEEVVRYRGPATSVFMRWAWEDVKIGGKLIKQGDSVNALLHAANRDPEVFDDPDRFDITRSPNKHLGFGAGVHYCLGAPLARMEGAIAIPTLLRRLPNLGLAVDPDEVQWNGDGLLFGLATLPVRF
ncbi:MAG TPA: cytochrome P450 [Candidatus Binatia bacterium]|nr:cytochrome P450 [Candidatus Binatia bacterium]